MSEIRLEVKNYVVDMLCDRCGEGYMRPEGNIVLTTYPLQYPHKCNRCGYTRSFIKKYPYLNNEYWKEEEEFDNTTVKGFIADEWYRENFG
jgi:ribosomal protein L37E